MATQACIAARQAIAAQSYRNIRDAAANYATCRSPQYLDIIKSEGRIYRNFLALAARAGHALR